LSAPKTLRKREDEGPIGREPSRRQTERGPRMTGEKDLVAIKNLGNTN